MVNGNARSRSGFFTYAAVSIFGLKGFDKVGKLGKLGRVSKTKPTLPNNVLNTEKLKGFIYNKVKTNFSNQKAKIVQFFKNKPVQITLNQAVRAVQNTKTLSTIKNVVNPNKLKYVFENTYRDVIKSPLTKTKAAIDQSIKSSIKKIGEVKVPTSFKRNQLSISGVFNFINVSTESASLKDVVQKFNVKQESRNINININGTKHTSKNSEILKFTEEQLSSKPPYSRDPEKWLKKGGKIEISEEGIWTYIDWEIPPNRVSYPGSFPDFKSAGLVRQEVQLGKFDRYDIDFATADELAPNGPKLDENTWHHHQDLKTMQEVNKEIHRRFRHMGGMSLTKKLKDNKE
ncbi:HNH endonuclease [Bacillus sp. DNRA2]|uniref:HNH endonuclease n=1 Tax=Bacillus sp. DNRA2 TaxID=2723053 RepID=UPI0032B82FFC